MTNFAIIGTNFITDKFLDAAFRRKDFHLKAVYSRNLERAKAYGIPHGADLFFDDLNDLANCSEIDVVYVASPNCCHAVQSILMMNHGKHVICEKPIASNQKEFTQMKEAALANHVILLEAMRSVYNPGFLMIQDNLEKLGTLRRATFQFCQYSSRYDKYKNGIIENAFNPDLSNSALMDIGVYCVHPAAFLFGMPSQITSSSVLLPNGMEGEGTALLSYPAMICEIIYSKISFTCLPSQIQGENATMLIQHIENPQDVEIHYRDGHIEKLEIPSADNDMVYEIDTLLKLIENGQADHTYLKNSEIELKIMDTVRKQQGIHFPADDK